MFLGIEVRRFTSQLLAMKPRNPLNINMLSRWQIGHFPRVSWRIFGAGSKRPGQISLRREGYELSS
jgi:hypothetical protein